MSDQTIDVRIQAVLDGFAANLASANATVQTTVAEMKGAFASLEAGVHALQGAFGTFALVAAGGAVFGHLISETKDWTGEVVGLSKRLGITLTEASGLAVALHHVGLGADEYGGFVQKMTRQMRTNIDAFTTLGIKTKEQNGEWRNSQDVMQDAVTKLSAMEAGTNRNIAASALFGARVGNLGPVLRLNAEMLEESREKAAAYHLIVGPEGAAQTRKYKDAMADLALIGHSLAVQIGNAVLPALTQLGAFFGQVGPPLLAAFGTALDGVVLLLRQVGIWAEAVFASVYHAARGEWGQAVDAITSGFHAAQTAALSTWDTIKGRWSTSPVDAGKRGTGETLGGDDLGKGGKDKAKAEAKAAYEIRVAAYKDEEELEKDHLDKILAIRQRMYADAVRTFGQRSKEALTALREVHATERAILQEQQADNTKASEAFRDSQLAKVQIARDALAQRKALGQVTAVEDLQQQQQLADREYAIKLAEYGRELQLYNDRPKELRRINAEIAKLQEQHGVEVAKNQGETATAIVQSWAGVTAAIGNTAGGMFTGLLTGSQTFMGSMRNLAGDFERLWAGAIAKTVAHWAQGEVAKTGLTAAAWAQRTAIEAAGFLRSAALHAADAIRWIATEGAKAAASAWSALAGIPFIGPVLAPTAAAAALAGVLALGSKVASASGGYDIPAGLNPVTQLHAEEMVLPAHLANPLREMLAGGGNGAGGGGGNTYHLHAMDAQSFVQFAKRNPEGFAHGVASAVRAGHLVDVRG